jgi:hypothetical protein
MSVRNLPEGKGSSPAREADNLTAIFTLAEYKLWAPRRLTALWASTVCYRNRFVLTTDLRPVLCRLKSLDHSIICISLVRAKFLANFRLYPPTAPHFIQGRDIRQKKERHITNIQNCYFR